MKILMTTPLATFSKQERLANGMRYLSPESWMEVGFLKPFDKENAPDVWIADGGEVEAQHLQAWRNALENAPLVLALRHYESAFDLLETCRSLGIATLPFPLINGHGHEAWEESVLLAAEELHTELLTARNKALVAKAANRRERGRVLLVGAGIVNLITAEYLLSRGYAVEVLDAAPDPRTCEDWTCLGVTNGGGNARMFTLTEADNYNEKGSKIYQNMQTIFRKTVRQGSWSVKEPMAFSPAEMAWIHAFENIPPWLARVYSKDIYTINSESGKLWEALRDSAPELFEGVEYCGEILRMYVDPMAVPAAVKLNTRLDALLENGSLEDFLQKFPVFRPSQEAGELAGGIKVKGFTVNVHAFVERLISRIEGLGGTFRWDCRVDSIARNAEGEVCGLRCGVELLRGSHYVLSPGVGGRALLEGFDSRDYIQGVLGVWLQIPNLAPKLRNSIKIHRRGHLVEDINVTIARDSRNGEDILVFGGGYGYVGHDRPDADSPELAALFAELEEVARIYFPEAHAQALAQGGFYPQNERRYCIRPFTPTGLGVVEMAAAEEDGILIVTGGHNTGGFAQSPAVAQAVWQAFEGIPSPLHSLFHPARGQHMRSAPQDVLLPR